MYEFLGFLFVSSTGYSVQVSQTGLMEISPDWPLWKVCPFVQTLLYLLFNVYATVFSFL